MTSIDDLERMLDRDPLGVRLSRVAVPPVSDRLRAAVATGRTSGSVRRRRLHRAAILAAGVTAVSLVVVVTPAGAALGRALLPPGMQQRLGLVEGAPTVLTPPGGPTSGPTRPAPRPSPIPCSMADSFRPPAGGGGGGVACYPDLSLAQAQARVTFPIPTPSSLPAGVTYRGALVESPHAVYLSYLVSGAASGGLGLTVRDDVPIGGSAVPSGSLQRVEVGGDPGYLVRGSYEDAGPGTPARWNPDADAYELTWRHGGLTYDLQVGGLRLGAQDVLRIAESVG